MRFSSWQGVTSICMLRGGRNFNQLRRDAIVSPKRNFRNQVRSIQRRRHCDVVRLEAWNARPRTFCGSPRSGR